MPLLLQEEENKKFRELFLKDVNVFQGCDGFGIWLSPMQTLGLERDDALSTSLQRALQFTKSKMKQIYTKDLIHSVL